MKQLIVLCVCCLALAANAQQPSKDADSLPVEIAKKRGVKRCLGAVIGMSNFAIRGNPHEATCVWSTKNPDEGIFACTIILKVAGIEPEYVSMSVVPSLEGSCGGELTYVMTNAEPCETLRTKFGDGWKQELSSPGLVITRNSATTEGVTLSYLSNGKNCTSIRREVINLK